MCPNPFEGISDLLQNLRNRNIRLAMGMGRFSTAISLKEFKLEDCFEKIETGKLPEPRKPEGISSMNLMA